jgi:hypothetical protein
MDDRDQHIREIAYSFWLEEGCPEGRADQHWAAAGAFVEAVANGQVAEPVNGENRPLEPLSAPARPMDTQLPRRPGE